MPLLAFNRKDTGGESIGSKAPKAADKGHRFRPRPPGHAFTVAVSWPVPGLSAVGLTQSWLHRLVIGSAAAFRGNPGNVAVRVLHIAGFAVDAVLGVDLEARTGGLLDPFIDAGRTIA